MKTEPVLKLVLKFLIGAAVCCCIAWLAVQIIELAIIAYGVSKSLF